MGQERVDEGVPILTCGRRRSPAIPKAKNRQREIRKKNKKDKEKNSITKIINFSIAILTKKKKNFSIAILHRMTGVHICDS